MSYLRSTFLAATAFLILACGSNSDDAEHEQQQQQPVEWRCANSTSLCVCEGNGDPSFYKEAACESPNTCCRLDKHDDVCSCGPYTGEQCTQWVSGFGDYQAVQSCPPP